MNEAYVELTLDYLHVLLSTPPMMVLVVFVLVWVFRSNLKEIMSRIATIKFPGGEISTVAQTDSPENTGKLPPGQKTALPEGLTLSPEQQKLVSNFIQAQQITSRLWEYRYLNSYFVPNTQRVLDWLAIPQNHPSIELFHALWLPAIPMAAQRGAILSALEKHQLITGLETMIEITEKGREYLQWRGPLPDIPSPKSS